MTIMEAGKELPTLAKRLRDGGYVVEMMNDLYKLKVNTADGRARFCEYIILRMDLNDTLSFYWLKYGTKISDATDIDRAYQRITAQLSVATA